MKHATNIVHVILPHKAAEFKLFQYVRTQNIPNQAPLGLLLSGNTPERKFFIWQKIFLLEYE